MIQIALPATPPGAAPQAPSPLGLLGPAQRLYRPQRDPGCLLGLGQLQILRSAVRLDVGDERRGSLPPLRLGTGLFCGQPPFDELSVLRPEGDLDIGHQRLRVPATVLCCLCSSLGAVCPVTGFGELCPQPICKLLQSDRYPVGRFRLCP